MSTKFYKLLILIVILAMATPTVAFSQASAAPTTGAALTRSMTSESALGNLVADSMLWKADSLDDGAVNGSVDAAFIDAEALQADLAAGTITAADAAAALPGESLRVAELTGAQIQDLLDDSARLTDGLTQVAGASYFWYNDTGTAEPTAWGAYGIEIEGQPLDRTQTYRVATADTGADTGVELQEALLEFAGAQGVALEGDARITALDQVVTILHTNDTHGQWEPLVYGGKTNEGFAYLATLIAEERAQNPNLLLLDGGDSFQGNSYAYFFRNLPDNAIAQGMNWLDYDAMVLGNHEFNFGPITFANMLGQLDFPILGSANLDDDGSYGFINDHVQDYVNFDVDGVKVSVFGLTNPRVFRYELPSNIPGLTFYPVLDVTQPLVDKIRADEDPDVLVGLNHIGYSPYGDETDSDTLLADTVSGLDVLIGAHSHTTLMAAEMRTTTANTDGVLIAQTGAYATNLGKINIGFVGGEMVLREGYLIPANNVAAPDPAMMDFMAPYIQQISEYNNTVVGTTVVPIDALKAYTEETNGANIQADSAVWAVSQSGQQVDFHLSGAMSNKKIAAGATPDTPLDITRGNLFTLMPYENSLVVLSMNGPQIKQILERGYRNWFYYTYYDSATPRWGGYSHYTTCMLTTEANNQITYRDTYPTLPDGNNVISMVVDGKAIDFNDAGTYYNVSSVNYLVAGSCNFNDGGVTIWPLEQIVADTQYYVRDSVTDYIESLLGEPIAPAIEGRLAWMHPGACPTTAPYGIGYWKANAGKRTDCVSGTLPLRLGTLLGEKSVMVDTRTKALKILNFNNNPANGIDKLYAQLLAAKLNIANGVDSLPVAGILYEADYFLGTHNSADWTSLTRAEKQAVMQWMTMLEMFNSGG